MGLAQAPNSAATIQMRPRVPTPDVPADGPQARAAIYSPAVLQMLLVLLPIGLAAAISPVMLTEQTLLLAGPGGRRTAGAYALGAGATLLVVVLVLILFGRAAALPDDPALVAVGDVVIGAALVGVAAAVHLHRTAHRRPAPAPPRLGPGRALGFGVFSMATNFTTLALIVPGARIIAAEDGPDYVHAVGVIVLVGLAAIPAWVPIALTSVAPGPASRALGVPARLITRHGRTLAVLALLGIGAVLLAHGLASLIRL
jgi:hypothetical protein